MKFNSSAVRHRRSLTSVAPLFALALIVGGCGGSDDSSDATDADPSVEVDDSPDVPDEAGTPDEPAEEPEAEPAAEGSGTATMIIEDGTVYEFVLTSCDTQDTNPSGFPLSNGYDVSGKTADGAFGMSFSRAGFDDEDTFFAGSLEGDFDEEGKNNMMLYQANSETVDLTASGNEVSGSFDLRAIGPPTRPHGDETTGTLEATC